MGHIKEPEGIDFVVDPTPLSEDDKKRLSEIIAHYKATGRKPSFKKNESKINSTSARKKGVFA